MSVLLIVRPKCSGRVACCSLVIHARSIKVRKRRDRHADRQTDGRQTVTLRLPLDKASVVSTDHF